MSSFVIAANRLEDGAVVFRTSRGEWTRDRSLSWLVPEDRREPALAEATNDYCRAVAVALVELSDPATRTPLRARERILFAGPTPFSDQGGGAPAISGEPAR